MVPETNAHFEPVAWWYTRKKIGRGLAQHYELADDLPPRLLALISAHEIENLIHELHGLRKRLETERDRIQIDIARHSELSQGLCN
jgi:hypothetical protein